MSIYLRNSNLLSIIIISFLLKSSYLQYILLLKIQITIFYSKIYSIITLVTFSYIILRINATILVYQLNQMSQFNK
jgi:hypothetical protein